MFGLGPLWRMGRAGLLEFQARVGDAIDAITEFCKEGGRLSKRLCLFKVGGAGFWRILLCTLIGGCGRIWSRLLPFWSMIQKLQLMALVSLLNLKLLMSNSEELEMPFFCRGDRGNADLEAFRTVAEELTPLIGEVRLPPLSGDMLYEVVPEKKPTAGSLDGWGWREIKVLPVALFDRLTSIFTLVQEEGVWPDGLLDVCYDP